MKKHVSIQQYDLSGNLIATYASGQEAATAVGCSKMAISYNVNGKTAQCAGYVFKKEQSFIQTEFEALPVSEQERITAEAVRHYNLFLGYALNKTKNMQLAIDLLQDAYLRFFEKKEYSRSKGSIPQWFHGTINKMYDRKFGQPHKVLTCHLEDWNTHTEDFGLSMEDYEEREHRLDLRRKALMDALDKRVFSACTPEKARDYRRVLELYLDGCLISDMAEICGLTEGSMHQKLLTVRKFVCDSLHISTRRLTRYNYNHHRKAV